MSLRPLSTTISFLLKIVVPALALFLLLNFVYVPSCGKFACSYEPSWWPATAQAADGADCPPNIAGAADSPQWAADRLDAIWDEHITTALFYDEDGTEHRFVSGIDAASRRVEEVLRAAGEPFPRSGPHPAISHAETKAAVHMRDSGVRVGVMVINHPLGVCSADSGFSCVEVLPVLLPPGGRLVVWSGPAIATGRPETFTGRTP